MYARFQTSYQRVEASLQKLVDSIAAYNPSTQAADDLVAADDSVNNNIEQLIKHQQNHLRLQELRQTAESLDETIKSTIRILADTRKDILSIPSTDTSDRGEVNVNELLSYAKFIARTTVPPTARKPTPEDAQHKPAKGAGPTDTHITNGIATPPQASQDADSTPADVKSEVAIKAMTDSDKQWLMPEKLPFEPWPGHEIIQRGNLAKIQKMLENGEDPASVLSAEEQAEADRKRKEQEEEERKKVEELDRKQRETFGDWSRKKTVDVAFNPDDL